MLIRGETNRHHAVEGEVGESEEHEHQVEYKLTERSFETNGEVSDDTIQNGLGENVRYLHKALSCCIRNWRIHSCGFLSVENCSFDRNDWLYRRSVADSKKETSRVESSHNGDQILCGSPLGTNVPEHSAEYNRSDSCKEQSHEVVRWTSPVDKVLFPEAELKLR